MAVNAASVQSKAPLFGRGACELSNLFIDVRRVRHHRVRHSLRRVRRHSHHRGHNRRHVRTRPGVTFSTSVAATAVVAMATVVSASTAVIAAIPITMSVKTALIAAVVIGSHVTYP